MRMAREEQTADGKLVSKKISEENEHDTVQSFDEINTYLQNTLISTNWHSLQHFFFSKRRLSNQCCLLWFNHYEWLERTKYVVLPGESLEEWHDTKLQLSRLLKTQMTVLRAWREK